MKKITRFILMIAFLISAVRCSVDAQKIPIPVDHPISPSPDLDAPPLIIDDSDDELFHIYSDQERWQIRQNIIGRYQYQQIIIYITENFAYLFLHFGDRQELHSYYPYTVAFPSSGEPELILNNTSHYYIECDLNNPTQVVGFNDALNTDIYFHRLENNENNNPHDEL